jgi:hypothetical protein
LLIAAGAALTVAAMAALWWRGGGLPMNAFPPQRFVATGAYRWFRHPIYVGFVAACAGVAIVSGSATGLYVVTPTVALGALALVLGYEGPATERRFPGTRPDSWLALPRPDQPLTVSGRIAVAARVLLPWLVLYLWVVGLGAPTNALEPYLPGEQDWPVWPWTYPIYASTYLVVALAPFWARGARALADFARAGLAAIGLNTSLYLVVPAAVPARPFEGEGLSARLLTLEANLAGDGGGALPSFHVTWALLAAVLAARSFPRWRGPAFVWAAAVAVSCVTTGMHAVADVVAGIGAFGLVSARAAVWQRLRGAAERLANSFRTWRAGPFRFFVHAPYAGFAAAIAVWIASGLVGATGLAAVTAVVLVSVVSAALWAQWIEGASVSLRPFGYYGSVVGATLACLALPWIGQPMWPVAGGLAVAAPFAQAIGRMRCLVQGCCHGRPAPAWLGIVCRHPQSRAVRLAGFDGVPIHPTQLYSLLWNLVLGVVLLRCLRGGQPPSVIAGFYLVGNGLGRFV